MADPRDALQEFGSDMTEPVAVIIVPPVPVGVFMHPKKFPVQSLRNSPG